MWWIVKFIDTCTDTPVETDVPVKADNVIEAKERASRIVPYLLPHSVIPQLSDYTREQMTEMLNNAYGALCDFSDGNPEVSDFEFQTGIDFYHETWEALND